MNVAYVSRGEAHEDLARRLTRARGLELAAFWPTDADPCGEFPIVIYDLDFLPADHRDRIVRRTPAGREPGVVGAPGYNLTRRKGAALRRNGVLVSRRLGARLLARVL